MTVQSQFTLTVLTVHLIMTDFNQGMVITGIDAETAPWIPAEAQAGVQQNFQNLIDSAAKSDTRNEGEIYRDIIKRGVADEQRTFDGMKEEIRATRSRNADKMKNSIKYNVYRRSPAKRETDKNVCDAQATKEDDEKFVATYGNEKLTSGTWELICQFPFGDDSLKKLAKDAHKQAGMGEVTIMAAAKERKWVHFYDIDKLGYIKVDVLVYCVEGHVHNDTQLPYFYYMTKGLRPDCVYYLKSKDSNAINTILDKHVCGVTMPIPPAKNR